MLAATAMEESSCNANAVGEGGEQGIMQISKDKCTGAPAGNCREAAFNIMTGAKFMADTLASNGNNIVLTIGEYVRSPTSYTCTTRD
jgi:soluble lytic murein transglycosylase-like protein